MISLLNGKLLEHYDSYPLFGIILFTEAHPHVIKVLKDVDYWNALDEISGEQLAIFATRLFKGELNMPVPRPGVLESMIPLWKEPAANKEILSWFEIQDSRELPLFALFGIDDDDLFYKTLQIRSQSVNDVYNSIREVVNLVSNFIGKNRANTWGRKKIFDALILRINLLTAKKKAQQFLELIGSLRSASGI